MVILTFRSFAILSMIQPNLFYKYNEILKSTIIVITLRENPQKFQIIVVMVKYLFDPDKKTHNKSKINRIVITFRSIKKNVWALNWMEKGFGFRHFTFGYKKFASSLLATVYLSFHLKFTVRAYPLNVNWRIHCNYTKVNFQGSFPNRPLLFLYTLPSKTPK